MPAFSKSSRAKLDTCHPDLVKICDRVVEQYDITVLEGKRSDELQAQYFEEGKSKLNGVTKKSKHQVTLLKPLSEAVDIAPYPVSFENTGKARARFYMLAGYMFQAAEDLFNEGEIFHKLRWGGDWDNDKEFDDQSFDDLPHFELVAV